VNAWTGFRGKVNTKHNLTSRNIIRYQRRRYILSRHMTLNPVQLRAFNTAKVDEKTYRYSSVPALPL